MSEKKLTMVLLNWKRPANLLKIVAALRRQTLPMNIFVWNNSPDRIDVPDADWTIHSSANVHSDGLLWLWSTAKTEFVARIDDDLMPSDDNLFEDAVTLAEGLQSHYRIIGAFGWRELVGSDYRHGVHIDTPEEDTAVDMVKGRLMLLRRPGFQFTSPDPHMDLHLSAKMADRFRDFHVVPGLFRNRLTELPAGDVGYDRQADHYTVRNKIVAKWLETAQ